MGREHACPKAVSTLNSCVLFSKATKAVLSTPGHLSDCASVMFHCIYFMVSRGGAKMDSRISDNELCKRKFGVRLNGREN